MTPIDREPGAVDEAAADGGRGVRPHDAAVAAPSRAAAVGAAERALAPAGERRLDPRGAAGARPGASPGGALNRRERTELELRGSSPRKRVAPEDAERGARGAARGRLRRRRRASPQRFADDRRRLDAWGAERIERRLRALGVAPEHIAAALGEQRRGGRARGGARAAAPARARRCPPRRASATARSGSSSARATSSSSPTTRCAATPASTSARLMRGAPHAALRRVIAPSGSRYYDPRSDRPGLQAHLKLQQNSHFQARNPAASAVTAIRSHQPRATQARQTAANASPSRPLTRRPRGRLRCWPDARARGTARPAAHQIEKRRARAGAKIRPVGENDTSWRS